MLRTSIVGFVVLACTACMTQGERAARVQRDIDEMIAVYGPACEKLGYKTSTDPWRDCVIRLDAKDNIARYRTTPTTTTCFGHRGFFNCSTF